MTVTKGTVSEARRVLLSIWDRSVGAAGYDKREFELILAILDWALIIAEKGKHT